MLLNSSSFAQKILTDTETFAHKDCFSGHFKEYDSWFTMLTKGNQRKTKRSEILEQPLAELTALFPREKFDEFGGVDVLDMVKIEKCILFKKCRLDKSRYVRL
jgi:hypothetical protein